MQQVIDVLQRRRKLGFIILAFVALLGYLSHLYYPLLPPTFIESDWHMPLVYFLLGYKVIELFIFYFILYQRPISKFLKSEKDENALKKLEKKTKKFFFLVPQGSIVFGILSYKLAGSVLYLWIFLLIATITLLIVNPNKLTTINKDN